MKIFGYEGVIENNNKALIDETFSDLLIHTPQIPIQTVSQIDQIQLCSQNHFFQTILSLANKSRNKLE